MTRRSVLRTGAWSVPVIAMAVAAPAAAASELADAQLTWTSRLQSGGQIWGTVTVTTTGPAIDDAVFVFSSNSDLLFFGNETTGPPGWSKAFDPLFGGPYYPTRMVTFTSLESVPAGSGLQFSFSGTIPQPAQYPLDAYATFTAAGISKTISQSYG